MSSGSKLENSSDTSYATKGTQIRNSQIKKKELKSTEENVKSEDAD